MLWIKLLWNKIQVLISAPWKWHWLLKTTAHFLLLLLSFSLTFSRIDYLQLDNVTRFCFHLGTVAYTKTMALRVTLNYYCLNIRYDPTSFVLTSTHQLCVHAAHRGCESSTVTDTTQGDFTTHSTKGWILDHTVLRNWEKKKKSMQLQREEWLLLQV